MDLNLLILKNFITRRLVSTLLLPSLCLIFAGCLSSYKRQAIERYSSSLKKGEVYDVIIVPGIPFTGDKMGYLMRSRILWSWILYKNGIAKNIIYSGAAVHTPYFEAHVMGLYAQGLGVPPSNIFYDTCAKHTTENLFYSVQMARKKGFKRIAVASDIYQCFFLKTFIERRFEGGIDQLPLIKDSLNDYQHLDLRIDPSSALIENADAFVPLDEKENYWERMRGTLGMKIPWPEGEKEIP